MKKQRKQISSLQHPFVKSSTSNPLIPLILSFLSGQTRVILVCLFKEHKCWVNLNHSSPLIYLHTMFGDSRLWLVTETAGTMSTFAWSLHFWGPETSVNLYVCDYLSLCVRLYPASCLASAMKGFKHWLTLCWISGDWWRDGSFSHMLSCKLLFYCNMQHHA